MQNYHYSISIQHCNCEICFCYITLVSRIVMYYRCSLTIVFIRANFVRINLLKGFLDGGGNHCNWESWFSWGFQNYIRILTSSNSLWVSSECSTDHYLKLLTDTRKDLPNYYDISYSKSRVNQNGMEPQELSEIQESHLSSAIHNIKHTISPCYTLPFFIINIRYLINLYIKCQLMVLVEVITLYKTGDQWYLWKQIHTSLRSFKLKKQVLLSRHH